MRVIKGSPAWRARHEQRLAVMRAHFGRKRLQERRVNRTIKRPHSQTPQQLAHAIRIAAKMAAQDRQPNPLFIEALEEAATFFDAIVESEKSL